MYARVASATGWTWEYIGQCMTLPRLHAMIDYWKQAPPVNETAAAFSGYKPPTAPGEITLPLLDNAALTANMHTDPRTLKWITVPNG